jgi:nucleotide-binding universal stress UspA family protein
MRVLVGIDLRGGPELLQRLHRLLPLQGGELVLAHVIDNGARGEMDLARGWLVHRPMPRHHRRQVDEAEREAAREALEEAARAARRLGAAAETVVAEGEPGRVLAILAAGRGCELAVVAARSVREGEVGPHSVGHTARFLLDHSPCPVLLLRRSPPPPPGPPPPRP